MAEPVASFPAFELVEGSVAVVKKSSTSGPILGQVTSINPQQTSNSTQYARLGSTTKKSVVEPKETTVAIEMYTEHTLEGLADILGGTAMPSSGGWVGTEEITLNPTITAFDLLVEVYDVADSATADLEWTYTLSNFKPTSFNMTFQADSALSVTINGDAEDGIITPEAGLGA